jgi:hypothetical protein
LTISFASIDLEILISPFKGGSITPEFELPDIETLFEPINRPPLAGKAYRDDKEVPEQKLLDKVFGGLGREGTDLSVKS